MGSKSKYNYSDEVRETLLDTHIKRKTDLICFSHLRWDFVFQRPQHLLTRAAKDRRVYYVEEPVETDGSMRLDISEHESGVNVVVPRLPQGLQSAIAKEAVMQQLIERLLATESVKDFVAWYYTPMPLGFTRHLRPTAVVYDCMDELSAFKNAPADLKRLENELLSLADIVFTGGQSLFEAKRNLHKSVHAFPSSIDREHFCKARGWKESAEPNDQRQIPHPRLGFFGVIDERLDIDLLTNLAASKPDWNFVIIGPVVKIDPETLPRLSNIHYLGAKNYSELPSYLAGWDLALLLFARNEATRFISPTKTPEYLAAGKRVVSTSIRDVVRPYGESGLVEIADRPDEFIRACERAMSETADGWLKNVDSFLAGNSWDLTWTKMSKLIDDVVMQYRRKPFLKAQAATRTISGSGQVAGAA